MDQVDPDWENQGPISIWYISKYKYSFYKDNIATLSL